MIHKRGQLAVFILLGLVIIASLLFLVTLNSTEKETEIPADLQPIKAYVEDCIGQIGSLGLFLMGMQGGYVHPLAPLSLRTNLSDIAYAYYEGVVVLVPLPRIGSQFSEYIEEQLPSCIDNFEAFPGNYIASGKIKAETVFTEKETIVNVNYPLIVRQGDSEKKIADFSATLPVRFKKIYEVAEKIVENEEENPEEIDITYIKDTGLDAAILPANGDTIIYLLSDNESRMEDSPYLFMFANKFDMDSIKGNAHAPVLEPIADISISSGMAYTVQINASDADGDELRFYAYSLMAATIDQNGLMTITPAEEYAGMDFVMVIAEDSTGLRDSQIVEVTVNE